MFLSFEVHELWTNCFRPTKIIALSSTRIKSNLKLTNPSIHQLKSSKAIGLTH